MDCRDCRGCRIVCCGYSAQKPRLRVSDEIEKLIRLHAFTIVKPSVWQVYVGKRLLKRPQAAAFAI